MTIINFYHLTTSPLERALPKLLEKSYAGGYRTIVVARDPEHAERLNTLLWTYDPNSFLPHGSAAEGNEDRQPILLTSELPGRASGVKQVLFITNGQLAETAEGYDRIIDMFDGSDEISLAAARTRWKSYKDKGLETSYFRQNERGGWDKAA